VDYTALSKIVLFLAFGAASIAGMRRQWINDPPGFRKTLKLVAALLVFSLAGVAPMIALVPEPPGNASGIATLALIGFILSWIFLGSLWLARHAPRYNALPRWVDHRFGPVESTLMAVCAASVLTLLLL